jgi:DNA (cytosine-5)-methyltransferase 1
MSLGVREACHALGLGFRVVLAVDFDRDALSVYKANLPVEYAETAGVETIFDGELGTPRTPNERKIQLAMKQVDILIGGPPCQGHSDLNNFARRDDPKNLLYSRMARAAEILRPRLVIVENVAGAFHDRKRVVQDSVKHLRGLGYDTRLGIVDATELGIPQKRRRLFLLASLRSSAPHLDRLPNLFSIPARDVRWAIEDLAGVSGESAFDSSASSAPDTIKRIAYLFEHGLYDLPNELRPSCHRDKQHTYKSIYGRLRWEQQAQTVTSGFYSMCMGRYVHPSQPRTLTAHEAARLQFFPDFFQFDSVKKRSALAQMIGNAVPVKLAYAVALQLLAGENAA